MTNEIDSAESPTSPWSDFDRAFADLHARLFDGGAGPFFGFALASPDGGAPTVYRAARTDLRDSGPAYHLTLEVPGIPKEKLQVRVRGASVEVRGEQATAAESTQENFVHRERRYSGFYRAVELPEPVVAKSVTAKVENGLLELELPKEHPTPEDVEVQVPVA